MSYETIKPLIEEAFIAGVDLAIEALNEAGLNERDKHLTHRGDRAIYAAFALEDAALSLSRIRRATADDYAEWVTEESRETYDGARSGGVRETLSEPAE